MELSSEDAQTISETIKSLLRLISNQQAVENGNKGLTGAQILAIHANAHKVLRLVEYNI